MIVFEEQFKNNVALESAEDLKSENFFGGPWYIGDIALFAFFMFKHPDGITEIALKMFPARDAWKLVGEWELCSDAWKLVGEWELCSVGTPVVENGKTLRLPTFKKRTEADLDRPICDPYNLEEKSK